MQPEGQYEPGTSASTIRGLHRLSTTVAGDLVMSVSSGSDDTTVDSPHSAPPSPSSPSGDSVSSFPSEISSSFLFSSGPGSPPHSEFMRHRSLPGESDGELHDSTQGLIIPSPSPGENDDIVELGAWEETHGADDAAPTVSVLRASTDWVEHRDAHGLEHTESARNVEIVELPGYDPSDDAETVLERALPIIHSPFKQVSEALHPDYAPSAVLANLISSGSTPLYTALILLLTSCATSGCSRLSSPLGVCTESFGNNSELMLKLSWESGDTSCNVLDTGRVQGVREHHYRITHSDSHISTAPTPLEKSFLNDLSPHIPVIVLPPLPAHPTYPFQTTYPLSNASSAYSSPRYPEGSSSPHTAATVSSFRPATPHALRTGLFRAPETLARLRSEAASRFLRWREVERAVEKISPSSSADTVRASKSPVVAHARTKSGWDKAQWEAEWEGSLSQEIAVGLQQRRRADTALPARPREEEESRPPVFSESRVRRGSQCAPAPFDPLHLGSLFMFSLSLLGPLKSHIARSLSFGRRDVSSTSRAKPNRSMGFGLGLALVGAFCAGIGLGLLVARV
ncbi:uncharacterized protein B0H18DRAFT_989936 [Fomitopsis serialis]|uniref:uncharacterized protein n=1 Tax=Fomitopsis serialis TaxID=139415 RepID=UPI002008C47D|nr:uncharacterized protein B0H18DRAFT_989936 [Neoantrodia serialis]KAH9931552.1 hypothetical protein B0H18DRAFT_989936 [Neoantrodia serialis]